MDRRTFLALMTLAAASTSTRAFADQVMLAKETGDVSKITFDEYLRSVYNLSLDPKGANFGNQSLLRLGYSTSEAGQIVETVREIARKAGSYDNFRDIVKGKIPSGVTLSPRESALLRSISAGNQGTAKVAMGTWEGHETDTTWGGLVKPTTAGDKPKLPDGTRRIPEEQKPTLPDQTSPR